MRYKGWAIGLYKASLGHRVSPKDRPSCKHFHIRRWFCVEIICLFVIIICPSFLRKNYYRYFFFRVRLLDIWFFNLSVDFFYPLKFITLQTFFVNKFQIKIKLCTVAILIHNYVLVHVYLQIFEILLNFGEKWKIVNSVESCYTGQHSFLAVLAARVFRLSLYYEYVELWLYRISYIIDVYDIVRAQQ